MKQSRPQIGAHVSVAGGFVHGLERAAQIGAECIQIFGASPRQWLVREPAVAAIEEYKKMHQTMKFGKVFLHAPYLINLASPDAAARAKSVTCLAQHMAIAENINAEGVIFHLGSGHEMPKEKAVVHIAKAMKQVLKKVPGKAQLIMENSAGGGQKVGSRPEELGDIMKQVNSPRVKVCVDTAHAFESGSIKEYTPSAIKKFLDTWDHAVGIEHIVALHVNDSKTAYDSRHDRHENIGEGYIGRAGFKNLAKESRLRHTAWILEVPGFDGMGPDERNVTLLKSLFK